MTRHTLTDAIRYNVATIAECHDFIAQHRRTLAERDLRYPSTGRHVHGSAYVAQVERTLLPLRLAMLAEAEARRARFEAELAALAERQAA